MKISRGKKNYYLSYKPYRFIGKKGCKVKGLIIFCGMHSQVRSICI